jgi:hypothetical protein
MSPGCHLFASNVQVSCFRDKVEQNMTKLHLINRAVLPLHSDLQIAGAHCAFATNSEQIHASVDRWRWPDRPRTSRTFEMNVLLDASLPSNRDVLTQTHFRGLHHLVFATIGAYEIFVFDLLRKQVVGAVSQASATDAAFWNSHWLPITVGVMGTTVGAVPLHSACLDRDGKGLLIAGVSGAGKSTLSVALTRCGFSLISDDWTYVSQESDALIAHGIGAPVKLLPDAIQYFPEFSGRTPKMWFNGELAFEIEPEAFRQNTSALHSRPHWLMFLERDSAPGCDFAPYGADEARAFFESAAEKLPDQVPDASIARSAMIRRIANCRAWRVRTGESPQVTADAIRQFCERN